MAGPELAVGMGALSLAGGVLEGVGRLQSGDAAVRAADIEAGGQERAGKLSLAAGFERGRITRYAGQRVAGAQVAGYSASGVESGSGSALLTRLETAKQVELDALKQEFGGLESDYALRTQAALTRYGGQVARHNARSAAIGSILGGASKAMLFASSAMGPKPTGTVSVNPPISSYNYGGNNFIVNTPR
jgi:hypothetical protein